MRYSPDSYRDAPRGLYLTIYYLSIVKLIHYSPDNYRDAPLGNSSCESNKDFFTKKGTLRYINLFVIL